MPEDVRDTLDLLVVGAGPTGIAIGAEARKAGLDVLLADKGALTQAILDFPTHMTFFTTRDLLEIAGIPMSVPDEKPTRQQTLAYYRAVAKQYRLPLALHERVDSIEKSGGTFTVHTAKDGKPRVRKARGVALATGYFYWPVAYEVPGAELPWLKRYYIDPYRHFGEDVVIVGGGNSACEMALDLWRNGARSVTMVVRDKELKDGVKYWVKPDAYNRIKEGSIAAHFDTVVEAFKDDPRRVEARKGGKAKLTLPCDAAYAMVGFTPDVSLQRAAGVKVDPETLVPSFDPATCESNVPGLYIAGTLQAGRDTGRIFIENSRAHAPLIIGHLRKKLGK